MEQHKAHVLLYADLRDEDALICAILVSSVYQVYVSKRHSGADCKVFSSLFIEHANQVALNNPKTAPVWIKALKRRR